MLNSQRFLWRETSLWEALRQTQAAAINRAFCKLDVQGLDSKLCEIQSLIRTVWIFKRRLGYLVIQYGVPDYNGRYFKR